MTHDAELLRRYAAEGDEEAFTAFVRENLGVVMASAARRLGGDEHRAREVAQQVFIAAARNAGQLARHRSVVAWLFTVTRHEALNLMRNEQRRTQRERAAAAEAELVAPTADARWEEIGPVLEGAMDQLSERHREALLLRFFSGLPLAEIGRRLGMSENAARMRVQRALEELSRRLARRQVTSTAAALGAALSARAAGSAASSEVAAALAKGALAAAASPAATTGLGAIVFMNAAKWTTVITTACVFALAIGTATYTWRKRTEAELELRRWQQEEKNAFARRDERSRRLAQAQSEVAQLESRVQAASSELADAKKRAAEAAAPRPWDPLGEGTAFMAQYPEVRRALGSYAAASVRFRFGALFRELQLTEEEIATFSRLVGRGIGMGAGLADGRSVTLGYGMDEPGGNLTQQLEELLETSGYQRYQELRRETTGRYVAREVASALYFTDTPLTPQQARELVDIIAATNPPGNVLGVVPLDWEKVIEQARGKLNAEQIAAVTALRAKGEFQRRFAAIGRQAKSQPEKKGTP
jgi:RNA polymerase sigma factor (sigma-70 family)